MLISPTCPFSGSITLSLALTPTTAFPCPQTGAQHRYLSVTYHYTAGIQLKHSYHIAHTTLTHYLHPCHT
jgi:hypothetical protein